MKKFGKKLAAILCMCAVLGTSYGTVCHAATGGITATITPSRISGTYTYGKPGQQLKIKIYGYEKNAQGKDRILTETSYANGDYTSVSATKTATPDYAFYEMHAFGYVNGNLDASKMNVKL